MLKNIKKIITNNLNIYPKTVQQRFFAINHKDIGSLYLFFGFYVGVISFLFFIILIKMELNFPSFHFLNNNSDLIFLIEILLILVFESIFYWEKLFQAKFFKFSFFKFSFFKFLKKVSLLTWYIEDFSYTITIPGWTWWVMRTIEIWLYGQPVLPDSFYQYQFDNPNQESLEDLGLNNLINESITNWIGNNIFYDENIIEDVSANLASSQDVSAIWYSDQESFSDDWSEFSQFFLSVTQVNENLKPVFLTGYYLDFGAQAVIIATKITES